MKKTEQKNQSDFIRNEGRCRCNRRKLNGKLDGNLVKTFANGKEERDAFTGTKVAPMPQEAPDLSKVRFGHPISLFNGTDMTGWRTYESDKKNGQKVIDNRPIDAPTPGAIYTDAAKPGPIYLQGDHTSVKYRDIYLAPVVKD